MKLDLSSIIALGLDGLSYDSLKSHEEKIIPSIKLFNERGQGFTSLPKLKAPVLAVKEMAHNLKGKFKDVVILGIGGSALGINCLRDSLKGPYWNINGSPRVFVLDNLDMVDEVEKIIDLDETLFLVISKSGRTPETMGEFFYFKEKVSAKNFLFITDPTDGVLRKLSKEMRIATLDIPKNVGGRFSVLTAVGLLPAALMGIDIENLLDGADSMLASFQSEEFDLNFPFQIATIQYLLDWRHGISMNVMMPYSTRLQTFADWYSQLLAESIGKDGKGLTPIRALGVTDQHSQIQLYNEGPNDKLIMFIEVEEGSETSMPSIDVPDLSYLSNVSFHRLMNLEKKATEQALSEYKKANLTIKIPRIDEYELGKLFMLFESSIAFLGEYYSIDAFNQPGVELGKTLTKKLLSQSK